MKIILDSMDFATISELLQLGIIDGVAVTPSMANDANIPYDIDYMTPIRRLIGNKKLFFVTILHGSVEHMIKYISGILDVLGNETTIPKIPLTIEGLQVVKHFNREGIDTAFHLVMNVNQAVIAMKSGVRYFYPQVGKLDDLGMNGTKIVSDMLKIQEGYLDCSSYSVDERLIASSIRSPEAVTELVVNGVRNFALPPKVIKQMIQHPQTDLGIATFKKDYELGVEIHGKEKCTSF